MGYLPPGSMMAKRIKYILTLLLMVAACAAQVKKLTKKQQVNNTSINNMMKIEIWSDVSCPFCYIGKHRLDSALLEFPEKDRVSIEWKSFQLDPEIDSSGDNVAEYLSKRKGLPLSSVREMIENVKIMASQTGLTLDFEKAIVANSFNAHRLLHLAREKGLQHRMEEALFEAHFKEGKDISKQEDLIAVALHAGLSREESENVLKTDRYAAEVKQDISEAASLNIQGVPFFIFNRKYAISGAQDAAVFKKVLRTSFDEWQKQNKQSLEVIDGKSCRPDGTCN